MQETLFGVCNVNATFELYKTLIISRRQSSFEKQPSNALVKLNRKSHKFLALRSYHAKHKTYLSRMHSDFHQGILLRCFGSNWPVGLVVKDIAIGAGDLGSIPGLVKSNTVANSSPPLRRFCVAQALRHGEWPRH